MASRPKTQSVFEANCTLCHQLAGGVGTPVGPDLQGVVGRPRDSLLVDILRPNRVVSPQHQSFVVRTKSGKRLSGVVANETAGGIVLRTPGVPELTIPRGDIADVSAWPVSLIRRAARC